MFGKRGMSPLIATILLMAFAVALGGMIMNWSSSIPDSTSSCESIVLKVNKFCLMDGKIALDIRNTGDIDLSAVALRIVDPPIINDVKISDSALTKGAQLNIDIPFANSRDAEVGILPAVGEEINFCETPLVSRQLPDC